MILGLISNGFQSTSSQQLRDKPKPDHFHHTHIFPVIYGSLSINAKTLTIEDPETNLQSKSYNFLSRSRATLYGWLTCYQARDRCLIVSGRDITIYKSPAANPIILRCFLYRHFYRQPKQVTKNYSSFVSEHFNRFAISALSSHTTCTFLTKISSSTISTNILISQTKASTKKLNQSRSLTIAPK